jgi:hypothetical protein
MHSRAASAVALALATSLGCAALLAGRPEPIRAPAPEGPAPWTALAPLRDPDEFRFVVVTDRTGNHREGVFEGALARINLLRPEFVVSVGDLIEGYTEDPQRLDQEWTEFEAAVARLQMPFFYAPGNHDMSNAAMAEAWRARFGPSFYHFVYRDALFLVLNSELFGMVHDPKSSLPGPWTQAEQMAMVEAVLREHAGARWTFVFVHQPLWDAATVHPDWLRVEELLGSRPYTVFAGHHHRYVQHVRHDRSFVTLATTGGGSRLRGTAFGEFDEVAQVTLGAEGPVVANLRLDGILPEDVVTAARRRSVDRLSRAIRAQPLLGSGALFRSGTARYEIRNRGGEELLVRGRPEPGLDLVVRERALEVRVPPRSSRTLALEVGARPALPYATLAPGRVRWTLATRDADGPVEIATSSAILPERRFPLARTRARLEVDGDLREWGALAFAVDEPAEVEGPGRHDGPADASFRFDARRDAEALHVAVLVRDDSVVAGPERSVREQDHVALALDARPDPARSANLDFYVAIRAGELRELVSVLAALEEPRPDRVMALLNGPPAPGVRSAARRTPEGYAVEIAIPNALLDARRGARWDAVRMNVIVNDVDAGEPDYAALLWRPSRFGERAVVGSGTFERR